MQSHRCCWMRTEDHEKSTETNHGRTDTGSTTGPTGNRTRAGRATRDHRHNAGPLAKKTFPIRPVWPVLAAIFRYDCPRTHVKTHSGWSSDFRRPLRGSQDLIFSLFFMFLMSGQTQGAQRDPLGIEPARVAPPATVGTTRGH